MGVHGVSSSAWFEMRNWEGWKMRRDVGAALGEDGAPASRGSLDITGGDVDELVPFPERGEGFRVASFGTGRTNGDAGGDAACPLRTGDAAKLSGRKLSTSQGSIAVTNKVS